MGLSTKKQTSKGTQTQNTTSAQQSTATTTQNVPDWLKNPTMQIAGNIGGLLNQGPGAFAPQTSGLQKQAFDAAAGLKNSGYLDQAGGALGGLKNVGAQQVGADQISSQQVSATPWSSVDAEAASLLDGGLDRYYNPFKDQITNPVLNDYDEQAGMTRAAQAAAAGRNKSFQGSRYGIQEAATEGQLARGRAATEGGLLSDMFKHSTSLASDDSGRRQQVNLANAAAANAAAQSNASMSLQASLANQGSALTAAQSNQGANLSAGQSNQGATLQADQANQAAQLQRAQQLAALGQTEGSESRANLGLQAGLGGVLTDQENAARQYPIQFQGQMGALLQGLNPSDYIGRTIDSSGTGSGTMTGTSSQTTKSNPSLFEGLGQAAQIAAMFAGSDRRLKRDIETVGFDAKGRRWVMFSYLWEPMKRVLGVIAQEVRRTDPEAVMADADGYLMVNYGALV